MHRAFRLLACQSNNAGCYQVKNVSAVVEKALVYSCSLGGKITNFFSQFLIKNDLGCEGVCLIFFELVSHLQNLGHEERHRHQNLSVIVFPKDKGQIIKVHKDNLSLCLFIELSDILSDVNRKRHQQNHYCYSQKAHHLLNSLNLCNTITRR